MLHAVVMAGGSGTRFWPASRRALPKQFLTVAGDRSLIQSTRDRCQALIPMSRFWVVTNARLADQTRQQLPELPEQHLLLEPCARNTAPCIALAALCLLKEDPAAVMLVMPADHVISDETAFQADVDRAAKIVAADPNQLVLFGVPPTYPATGFGYIEQGPAASAGGHRVQSFREKPDADTARKYLESGKFLWNCGIFVWRADRILDCLLRLEPETASPLAGLAPHIGRDSWGPQLEQAFPSAKSISIDYAVLERESTITVLEARFPWDDVGGWEAMARLTPRDLPGNAVRGQTAVVDTHNCIIRSDEKHLVAVQGVDDLIIVHTPDVTLVARRGDDEALRKLLKEVEARGLERYL